MATAHFNDECEHYKDLITACKAGDIYIAIEGSPR